MPGFMPGIHVFFRGLSKTWMAGTSGAKTALRAFCPAMTFLVINLFAQHAC
jgi:hypothetical protein